MSDDIRRVAGIILRAPFTRRTVRELLAFLYSLEGLRVVALDVMEVSPNVDVANITAAAAAKLVREAILLFASGGAPSPAGR